MEPLSSPPNRRIVGEQRQAWTAALTDRYRSGESIRTIMRSTGRSYGFVRALLAEGGVTFRPRGGAQRRRVRREQP